MSQRITQRDVEALCETVNTSRKSRGEKTWFTIGYRNGWVHVDLVDAETEAKHCILRTMESGTKRECYTFLRGAYA